MRQRAVDLLYAMCDRSNAQQIVAEMLSYLETADYSIREEIVSSGGLCVVAGPDACVSQLKCVLVSSPAPMPVSQLKRVPAALLRIYYGLDERPLL